MRFAWVRPHRLLPAQALHRQGVYRARSGWPRHLLPRVLACVVMTAAHWAGLQLWP